MGQLEFRSVYKRYVAAGPWVVDDLDLEIERGELVTLLGPSGCGKTTTLRLMAGLEWPTRGDIWLGGHDVTRLGAADRQVGMMFQSYALFPHLSVLDNVAYGLSVQSAPRARERALEMLRLVLNVLDYHLLQMHQHLYHSLDLLTKELILGILVLLVN